MKEYTKAYFPSLDNLALVAELKKQAVTAKAVALGAAFAYQKEVERLLLVRLSQLGINTHTLLEANFPDESVKCFYISFSVGRSYWQIGDSPLDFNSNEIEISFNKSNKSGRPYQSFSGKFSVNFDSIDQAYRFFDKQLSVIKKMPI